MIEDKIALALKDVAKLKSALKDIKKDMKAEEKISNEQYLELKSAYKDLRKQIKEIEEDHEEELKKDEYYNKLREMKLQKEEHLAHSLQDLFEAVSKLPRKSASMQVETEEGPVNVQIEPDMKVFVNGREEKPKKV